MFCFSGYKFLYAKQQPAIKLRKNDRKDQLQLTESQLQTPFYKNQAAQ